MTYSDWVERVLMNVCEINEIFTSMHVDLMTDMTGLKDVQDMYDFTDLLAVIEPVYSQTRKLEETLDKFRVSSPTGTVPASEHSDIITEIMEKEISCLDERDQEMIDEWTEALNRYKCVMSNK
jgi:hypothetical protein